LKQTLLVWSLAVIGTVGFFLYQTETGPTYPVKYDITVGGTEIEGELIRSGDIREDMEQTIICPDQKVTADLVWRLFPPPPGETWNHQPFERDGKVLRAWLPKQKMAGKIEFTVEFHKNGETVTVPHDEAAVARYKGPVPGVVLIIHIFAMFLSLLFSNAALMDAILGAHHLRILSRMTFGLMLAGGGVLGPMVQKYAFDAYWTGWPNGTDWTDNKLAVGAITWLIVMIICWNSNAQNKRGRWAVIFGALVSFAIFGIPHSIHGSTLDHETGEHIQAMVSVVQNLIG